MMTTTVAPALKVLLERVIDYAGIYPPAALPLPETLANFSEYRMGEHSWMLRSLVIGVGELSDVPPSLDGAVALLTEEDNERAASLETKTVVKANRPVYCEIAPADKERFDAVKAAGCFAKIRTGGLKPEAIPSTALVASFILECAQSRLPFKATAGLHHPVRATHPLTYAADAPRAVMHGFLNVLMASAFAWHGETDIEGIISETDPSAFVFDSRAQWRSKSLSVNQVEAARLNFMHSIGSCSFAEPVHELQALGLL